MKKFIFGALLVISFLLGVIFSDQVIHGVNKALGGHMITKETMAVELEDARHSCEIYKKMYFELKEKIEKNRSD